MVEAAEKLPFQEGRFEKGELKYVHHLPVLSVEGTPEEMGRQEAALTGSRGQGPRPVSAAIDGASAAAANSGASASKRPAH